jgi:hypothetical protein
MHIIEPYHGAVLTRHDGQQSGDSLTVAVRGRAELNEKVTVNGAAARRVGREFFASVVLREKETDIVATAQGAPGRREHRVRVVWDRHSRRRYRVSIDDNSFFLRDIAQKGYKSLFDCFYLRVLRDLHAKYGTKYTINLFFQTPEEDFSLNRFPDRYKSQWLDNADWLKLTFHAWQEFPDRPYQYAHAEKLLHDLDGVAQEIQRFAGQDAWCPPTIIHWAMVQPDCFTALASRGVRALSALSQKTSGGWDLNYRLADDQCEWLARHDALRDFGSGITFSNCDIVINNTPLDQIAPALAASTASPQTSEVLDLLTHEQYFWPFYFNYVPDHAQRLDAALAWATQNGYEPVFFHEGLLGGKE